jgi:hypothetical protein
MSMWMMRRTSAGWTDDTKVSNRAERRAAVVETDKRGDHKWASQCDPSHTSSLSRATIRRASFGSRLAIANSV